MKTATMKLFIAALAVMMVPALASAQMCEGTFLSKLTISLKVDQTVQALNARDENGKTIKPKELVWANEWMTDKGEYAEFKGKLQTTKIGNKEILEWLVEEQVIGSVKGAQLVLILGEGMLVAVEEADGNIVPLDGIIDIDDVGPPPVYDVDYKYEDTIKNGEKADISERIKLPIVILFELGDRESELFGVLDISMDMSVNEKKMQEKCSFKGGAISPLGGWLYDENSDNGTECFEGDCLGVADGSIKIGKGKEIEIVE